MPRCFVLDCGNYYSKTRCTDVMYHVFPGCKKLASRWVSVCRGGKTNQEPPRFARVCSLHFSPSCYQRDLQHELLGLPIRKKLKTGAVPDSHLPEKKSPKKKEIIRNDPKKRDTVVKKIFFENVDGVNGNKGKEVSVIKVNTKKKGLESKYNATKGKEGENKVIKTSLEEKRKDVDDTTNGTKEKKPLVNSKGKDEIIQKVIKNYTEEKKKDLEEKSENAFDMKLPVRSSIRIAKRRSIEHTTGPGNAQKYQKNQVTSSEEDKLWFMSTLKLDPRPAHNQDMKVEIQQDIKQAMKKVQEKGAVVPRTVPGLNRMHVMEDVEEGCDVSGALPSSPGHAEQRPDPPKETPELETVETSVETFAETPVEKTTKTTTVLEEESKLDNLVENVPLADDVVLATTEPEKDHAENGVEPSPEDKDAASKETEEVQEIRKEEPEAEEVKPIPTIAEVNVVRIGDEDSVSSDCLSVQSQHKRKYEEEDSPTKKLRTQIQQQYVTHDKILSEYIESLGCGTIEDLQIHTDQLLTEIRTLGEMAREKEREWNNILHLKKVKEELLLRLQRKKQVSIMSDKSESDWDVSQSEQDLDKRLDSASCSRQSKTVTVPVASTSPSASTSRSAAKIQTGKTRINQPKVVAMTDQNGGECRQGRQGPILDVRSIIADYRQKNPDTAPRRGRRLKSVLNRNSQDKGASTSNVLSMASLALGSGSQVRQGYASEMSEELGMLLSAMDSARQEHSRPCSADSSGPSAMTSSDFGMSFKDVLLQFARLSQTERQELQAQAAASLSVVGSGNKAPPPPYPEVTLHPVPSTVTIPVTTPQNSSLLHGILTKSQQPKNIDTSKPANFSPTLARLLSTPDRGSNVQQMQQPIYTTAFNAEVSITDLLSSGKSRNEITITPIGQFGQNVKHKHNEHLEEDEAEDSADRLVIDEGGEVGVARADNGSEAGDEVPHCQGCQQKAAQFVCAGCGNQWYCSRDCQVAAWDEHSELCSG